VEQPAGLGERLALAALAAAAAVGLCGWLVAELAGILFGDGPIHLPLTATLGALSHVPAHLADPRRAWPSGVRARLPGPVGFYAAAAIVLTAAAALAALGARLARRAGGLLSPASLARGNPDAARWARARDLRSLRISQPAPGRLTLGRMGGRLLAAEARQSAIVIGPTQSLKTTELAVPAILEWQGPVLATSVKTDLLRHTIARRRQLGDVLVFDPTESTGVDAQGWTPLSGCSTWHGAQRTAAALSASAKPGGATLADADFWYAAAAKLLAPLRFAAATMPEGSMADVVRWTDTQEVDEARDALEQGGVEEALQAAQANWGRDERQRSSIHTTAETVLAAYADPRVLAAAYEPDLTPERLLDGSATTAYLCAPSHEQQRLRPLFATLIEQVLAAAYERVAATGRPLDPPLLLVLDEAANVAAIPSLDGPGDRRRPGHAARLGLSGPGADQGALRRAGADDRQQPSRQADRLGDRRPRHARLRRPRPRRAADHPDLRDRRSGRPGIHDAVHDLPLTRPAAHAARSPARDRAAHLRQPAAHPGAAATVVRRAFAPPPRLADAEPTTTRA
jgi:type IV secretion system protein VirD4